jgi:hypothetical protein
LGKEKIVPKLLNARAPEDGEEERKIRKLAGSRHAPGDWILTGRLLRGRFLMTVWCFVGPE